MTDTPVMLGECGLYIQFDANENYRQSDWVISIPNKRGAGYVAAKNAYDLAITQQATAIKAAEEALTLARESERSLNAPSTPEIIAQAEANVATAKARLAAIEARVTDYTIRAPFPGVITNVDMKVGEAANQNHTVTVVYEGDYELKAQIPEIDIKKVSLSSSAEVLFDADPNTTFPASITFISPLSSDVSGVSYYDATIELTNQPDWIREGLNADVIIKHETRQAVTALPKRYLITENNNSYVLIQNGATTTKTRVDTGLVGTDGLVEIRNLPVGTSVVRP
jgi:multidrug efflux pump subunit AcrA (membrane-fusion protein)